MDGDLAPDLRQRLDSWRARGADRIDPVRFGLIDALARRAGAHEGQARRLLDARLDALVEAYARDIAPPDADEAGNPPAHPAHGAGALGALLDHLPARAGDPYPELPLLERFRALWAGLRTQAQLRQSLAPVPADAGPLNSGVLVHRALSLMRECSPGYLEHFIAYVDALSSLERLPAADAGASDAPRTEGRRKPAASRARKKPRD